VVSTGTRTLQDQIAEVDLPRLQRVLPEPFTFAVMKGLSNYLCLRRFDEHSQQLEIAATKSHETERVRAWATTTTTGDRADLDGVPDSAPICARSRPARRCDWATAVPSSNAVLSRKCDGARWGPRWWWSTITFLGRPGPAQSLARRPGAAAL